MTNRPNLSANRNPDTTFTPHPYDWLLDRLREEPSYLERPMFGCRACYLNGELKLVLAANNEEPWNGVLVCTSKEHHTSLLSDHSGLIPHPILPKWLYLSEEHDEFEATALHLVQLVLQNDPRIGVPPSSKPRKSRSKKAKSLNKPRKTKKKR